MLASIRNAPSKKLKFELNISSSAESPSHTLISEGNLKVYIVGEPKEYVEPPVAVAGTPAQEPPVAKPKPIEIAILLTPKAIEKITVEA